MPVSAGPIYPGIKKGLVFATDPANKKSWAGPTSDTVDSLTLYNPVSGSIYNDTSGSYGDDESFAFDGASDYIETTFNPLTSIGDNTSWTINSWVYVSNVVTQQRILGVWDATRSARFWGWYI